MLPLADWPWQERSQIIGVLTDIDDTLTTDGAITPDALQALAALKAAGLPVIAITGRPVGWSEPFAALWPVDAIVAENGAVALLSSDFLSKNKLKPPSNGRRQLSKIYQQDATTRAANFARMRQVAERVLSQVPEATLAQDSAGRETDIAIDHSEFAHLSALQIGQVASIMRSEGMNASVSSIHINGWFGAHNKLNGAGWIVRDLFQRDLLTERSRWAFVGDSTNDQVMFEAFEHSVGVANICRFAAGLTRQPAYITRNARGAGFAEVAAAILAARQTP